MVEETAPYFAKWRPRDTPYPKGVWFGRTKIPEFNISWHGVHPNGLKAESRCDLHIAGPYMQCLMHGDQRISSLFVTNPPPCQSASEQWQQEFLQYLESSVDEYSARTSRFFKSVNRDWASSIAETTRNLMVAEMMRTAGLDKKQARSLLSLVPTLSLSNNFGRRLVEWRQTKSESGLSFMLHCLAQAYHDQDLIPVFRLGGSAIAELESGETHRHLADKFLKNYRKWMDLSALYITGFDINNVRKTNISNALGSDGIDSQLQRGYRMSFKPLTVTLDGVEIELRIDDFGAGYETLPRDKQELIDSIKAYPKLFPEVESWALAALATYTNSKESSRRWRPVWDRLDSRWLASPHLWSRHKELNQFTDTAVSIGLAFDCVESGVTAEEAGRWVVHGIGDAAQMRLGRVFEQWRGPDIADKIIAQMLSGWSHEEALLALEAIQNEPSLGLLIPETQERGWRPGEIVRLLVESKMLSGRFALPEKCQAVPDREMIAPSPLDPAEAFRYPNPPADWWSSLSIPLPSPTLVIPPSLKDEEITIGV